MLMEGGSDAVGKVRTRGRPDPVAFGTCLALALLGPLLVAGCAAAPPAAVQRAVAPATITPRPTIAAGAEDTHPPATAAPTAPATGSESLSVVLDDTFAGPARAWPDRPQGTARYADGAYRLEPREPGHFVALDAPLARAFSGVSVWARFQKVGGPPGGGYGLVVADQGADLDGVRQDGQFVVLEVGDDGTVGVWERHQDHWVDLLPWTPNAAVRPGDAMNDLVARADGTRLTFSVNGSTVRQVTTSWAQGHVGVFVGGDGNQVALRHFVVQVPSQGGGQTTAAGAPEAAGTSSTGLIADLDAAWAKADWPTVFEVLNRIEQVAPASIDVRQKRYAAHMAAGQAALATGRLSEAASEFAEARAADPSRGEAPAALLALTPTPVPTPNDGPRRPDVAEPLREFLQGALGDLDAFWSAWFSERGLRYMLPAARMYNTAVATRCGTAVAGIVGPFYCPRDMTLYLETDLIQQIRSDAGDFPVAYVVAHETGHHVQRQLGISTALNSILFGQTFSREIELQADCLAGVWAHSAVSRHLAAPEDVTHAIVIAWQSGDPVGTSQRDPDAHGTPAQRAGAFLDGFHEGSTGACHV
jgi:uncharacterized protein